MPSYLFNNPMRPLTICDLDPAGFEIDPVNHINKIANCVKLLISTSISPISQVPQVKMRANRSLLLLPIVKMLLIVLVV